MPRYIKYSVSLSFEMEFVTSREGFTDRELAVQHAEKLWPEASLVHVTNAIGVDAGKVVDLFNNAEIEDTS